MIRKEKYLRFPEGRKKAVTLSYDDGVEQDGKLVDIVRRYHMRATFNIGRGCFAEEGRTYPPEETFRIMSYSQCKETYDRDVCEVATHGFTHPFLNTLETSMIMNQIISDRIGLEEMFDTIITGHAYPYGWYNEEVKKVLALAGISYARGVNDTHKFDLPKDWLCWQPTCHHDFRKLEGLIDEFLELEVDRESKLFYLWGHTFEFDRNQNWDVIEGFCEKMADRDEIWYATSGEIYQYVKAYESLKYSVDGTIINNPTSQAIWLEVDGEVLKVEAGSTVRR